MAKGRKTAGRLPGSLNKATVEVKQACTELVDDPEYRRNLAQRLRGGTLSPAVECMLWHYAKGKPHDEVQTDQHLVISWRSWRDEAGDGTAVEHQTRRPIALPARD